MIFLADENIEIEIVSSLKKSYEVFYISDISPSIQDKAVLEKANELGAILITSDKDFGDLVYRQRSINQGVIFIRLHGLTNHMKAEIVLDSIKKYADQLSNNFTVISRDNVRIRSILRKI